MIKLYPDEDVHKKVALALRLKGYDTISVHEIKKWGLLDYEQLDYAISKKRAIFTFNAGDFTRLHKEFQIAKKIHYGILLSKQIPIKELIQKLTLFLYKQKV